MRIACLLLSLVVFASPALAQTSSREDFREFCKLVEGRWICTDTKLPADWIGSDGEKVTSYGVNEIAVDGHALKSVWLGASRTAEFMTVFDNSSGEIRILFVDSDGTIAQAVMVKKDGKWTRTATVSHPDGTKEEVIATLVSVSDDGKIHTWKDSRFEGEQVWKRVDK